MLLIPFPGAVLPTSPVTVPREACEIIGLGRSASEVGAELVAESLRRADFAFIEFRDSAAGRQAFIQGTRLAVWQAISVLRSFECDVSKAAAHLRWPEAKVHAAVAYTKAFPEEIEEAIRDNASVDFEKLSRRLKRAALARILPVFRPAHSRVFASMRVHSRLFSP